MITVVFQIVETDGRIVIQNPVAAKGATEAETHLAKRICIGAAQAVQKGTTGHYSFTAKGDTDAPEEVSEAVRKEDA